MKTYDYLENVKEDVRNYIEENKIVVTSSNREEVEQELKDTLFELLTEALLNLAMFILLEKGAKRCRGLRRYNTLLPSWAGNFGGIGRNRNRKRNGGVNYENLYYRWMQRNVFNVARSKETYMVGLYAKGMY